MTPERSSKGRSSPQHVRRAALRALWTAGALAAGLALSACAPPVPDDSAVRGAQAQFPSDNGSSAQPGSSVDSAAPAPSSPSGPDPGNSDPSSSTAPTTTSSPGSTHPRPPLDRCHTSQLTTSLQNADAGAGQRYADLVLRNRSQQPCTVYGYGGMQLLDADGKPIPTNLERVPNPGPALVRLAPGGTAVSSLRWTVVASGNEPTKGQCQATPAGVHVTPPDETDPLTVSWNFGPVCNYGHVEGSAYH